MGGTLVDPIRNLPPALERRLASARVAIVSHVEALGLDEAVRVYTRKTRLGAVATRRYLKELVADEATYKERGPR